MSSREDFKPKFHHLDRRADTLAAALTGPEVGPEDELLTTVQAAALLGNSIQWWEIARHRGYGPRFIRLSSRSVRYRRSDIRKWLEERSYTSTAEYEARPLAEEAE